MWQVVDRKRRDDLAPSLTEHLLPTLEAADTETGSRAALRASRWLPRGSDAPRHCKAAKGHLRGSTVSVECLPTYYLRTEKDYQWLAYPHKLTVELGSYVDGEAHGWAR